MGKGGKQRRRKPQRAVPTCPQGRGPTVGLDVVPITGSLPEWVRSDEDVAEWMRQMCPVCREGRSH